MSCNALKELRRARGGRARRRTFTVPYLTTDAFEMFDFLHQCGKKEMLTNNRKIEKCRVVISSSGVAEYGATKLNYHHSQCGKQLICLEGSNSWILWHEAFDCKKKVNKQFSVVNHNGRSFGKENKSL